MTNAYTVTTSKEGLIGVYKTRAGAIEEAINYVSLWGNTYKRVDNKYGDSTISTDDVTVEVEVWRLG